MATEADLNEMARRVADALGIDVSAIGIDPNGDGSLVIPAGHYREALGGAPDDPVDKT